MDKCAGKGSSQLNQLNARVGQVQRPTQRKQRVGGPIVLKANRSPRTMGRARGPSSLIVCVCLGPLLGERGR